jgi:glycosyltransferase involved in cell wall biosynthesis
MMPAWTRGETNVKRVSAIVLNSVSHDARVLKEAESLASAQYEVTIFGLQDKRNAEPETRLPSGVRIIRISLGEERLRTMARLHLLGAVAALLLALGGLFHLPLSIHRLLSSAQFQSFLVAVFFLGMAALFHRSRRRCLRRAADVESGREPRPARLSESAATAKLGASRRRWLSPRVWKTKLWSWIGKRAMRRALSNSIAEFRPDLLHCHDLGTLPLGCAYKRRTGCPVIFDSHELYEEQSMVPPWKKRLHRWQLARLSGDVDGFITINDSIADCMLRRYPKFPPAVIIKNAARLPAAEVSDDGRLRRAAALEHGRKVLLYQGGFARFRGLETVVRSAALLPPEWCLVMMGWGNLEASLRSIALLVDPGGGRIRFVPPAPQGELAQWTAGATLGVIPYENNCLNHWFCTPNKLWEYPLAGVPILASPFPELRKVLEEHGVGRLLSDPVTAEGIAELVASLGEAELAEMKANCRRYIAADNWALYERRLIVLYRNLLETPRRASASAAQATPVPSIR